MEGRLCTLRRLHLRLPGGPRRRPPQPAPGPAVRDRRVLRRRSRLRRALPFRRRIRRPRLLLQHHAARAPPRSPRSPRSRLDPAERAVLPLPPRPRRHPVRAGGDHRHGTPPGPGAGPGRLLRGQQEDGVHDHELRPSRPRPAIDALLGQRGGRGGRCHPLRPVGNGQDHPVGRPRPGPDRRRRAHLDPLGDLQLRGRVLRQADRPRQGGRAGHRGGPVDEGHPDRERPPRRWPQPHRNPSSGAGPAGPVDHREHPLRLPAGVQPACGAGTSRPPPAHDRAADRGRFRRAAAGCDPRSRGGDVPLRHRLHRQAGRHRGGRDRAGGHLLAVLRRSVHVPQARCVRPPAEAADARAQGPQRAAQHGLVGRRLRRGPAHAAGGHPPAARSRTSGRIRQRRHPDPSDPGPDHAGDLRRDRRHHPRPGHHLG